MQVPNGDPMQPCCGPLVSVLITANNFLTVYLMLKFSHSRVFIGDLAVLRDHVHSAKFCLVF